MHRSTPGSLGWDTIHKLLAEPRRRYLLYELADDERGDVDELGRRIATWESEEPTDVTRERIVISLVHNHLPRLADHDVVDYDLRSGDVVLDENFGQVEAYLEQFKETEDDSSEPQLPLS